MKSALKFTEEERNVIFGLAERLTGAHQQGNYRRDILLSNVARRITANQCEDLAEYLEIALNNVNEKKFLVSALTIHTTSWFREKPHYVEFKNYLHKHFKPEASSGKVFKMWCVASSTGEEVYSFAFILEQFRQERPGFEYSIHATDIDPVSLEKAKKGIYSKMSMPDIPKEFHKFCWQGEGKNSSFYAIDPEIRKRITTSCENVLSFQSVNHLPEWKEFDWVVCRNVLIYFKPEDVSRIIIALAKRLHKTGTLCLGHSESIEAKKFELTLLGRSIYSKIKTEANSSEKPKILVIDDSESVRAVFHKNLSTKFDVVLADSAAEADKCLKDNVFDLISLDLHMPIVDGISWMKDARNRGLRTPIVIVSEADPKEAMSVLGALEKGAQHYVEKSTFAANVNSTIEQFVELVNAHNSKKSKDANKEKGTEFISARSYNSKKNKAFDVILIGASTGGTEAVTQLLKNTPNHAPPVVVVQHISHNFSKAFATRLAQISGLTLGDMRVGEPLKHGHLYLSLGDYHIGLQSVKGGNVLSISNSPGLSGHRPSVDFLFRSASLLPVNMFAIILTGMGKDGARGMLELHNKGALCLAQDEESSVVFGMPKEAIKLRAVDFVGNIPEIRNAMMECISRSKKKAA